MPTLTTLPCEIVVAILTELDDFQSLASSLLTCRYVYGCFKEGHGVETSLVRRHVTPALLPYAVATLEMSQLPKQCPYSRVYGLLNALYYNPDQLVGHMKTMPRKTLQKILRMYDIIHDLVKEYAKKAWLRFGQKRADPDSPGFTLSHDEHFRFCRAFYRVEIFYSLFRHSGNDSNNGTFMKFKQISHGIEFINELITMNKSDGWWGPFDTSFRERTVNIQTVLTGIQEDKTDKRALRDYSRDDLRSLAPDYVNEDTDKGGYKAWRTAHIGLPKSSWVMHINHGWLRDHAYVLWDLDRLQKHDLLKKCRSVHGYRLSPILLREVVEMRMAMGLPVTAHRFNRSDWTYDRNGFLHWG